MAGGPEIVLEEDVYNGESGHAEKHNAVNEQVNYLTPKVEALRTIVNSGRLSAGELATSTAQGASVINFRQLPDGDVDSIKATQGTFVALSSGDRTPYSISGGRLKASGASTAYLRVRAPGEYGVDSVQYCWAYVRFNTGGGANEAPLFVLPELEHDSLTQGPGPSGAHDGMASRFAGSDAGRIHAEGYTAPGTLSFDADLGYTLPGRTALWEMALDSRTGRRIHQVDGVRHLDVTDAASPAYTSRDAIFQFGGTAVELLEFGASCTLPPFALPGPDADNGYYPEVALANANQWYRIYAPGHRFSTGAALVEAAPYVRSSGGNVFMVAASYASMDYAPYYKPQLSSGAHDGRVPFAFRRNQPKGDYERFGIWAMCDTAGTTTINPGTVYSLEPKTSDINVAFSA